VSLVVGLAIERDHLRAVGLRGTRVLWGVDAALSDQTALGPALVAFLATLPLGRFARPRVTVALDSAFAQTKRLAGLPALGDERLLARTVHEHAARFFLKNGVPLVTTSVRLDADGRPWAAALQKNVVDTIVTACRSSRVMLRGIVPAADVARPAAVALTSLGRDASLFTAAYGAAVTSDALTWRAGSAAEHEVPRWRLVVAVSAVAVTLALAVLAPGLAARMAERRAIAHLAAIASASGAARGVARENELVTRALGEVGAFDRGRRPVTGLMAALARALPDGAALLALHVDSASGSIVVLAPRAGLLLTRLERVPGIAAAEITGPVTRETTGGRELERATVRFRWMTRP
jgi:hypothetical protein